MAERVDKSGPAAQLPSLLSNTHASLQSITTLTLTAVQLPGGLPCSIFNLRHSLKTLKLGCCNLKTLPDEICWLTKLDKLLLPSNHLTELPVHIGCVYYSILAHVFTHKMHLQRVTVTLTLILTQYRSVRWFCWFSNRQRLPCLPCFSLSLSRARASLLLLLLLRYLHKLKVLSLSHNKLKALPPSIGALPSLTILGLAGNPLLQPPDAIREVHSNMQPDAIYYFVLF